MRNLKKNRSSIEINYFLREITCYESVMDIGFPEDLEILIQDLFHRVDCENSGYIYF